MVEKEILVVVLGYGCHLTKPLKGYLDYVFEFIFLNFVSVIILTGGYTNRKSAPGVSEARMMSSHLRGRRNIYVRTYLDEESVTTKENLQNVARIIKEKHFELMRIVIFCDRARSLKVKILSKLILGYVPEIKTYELSKGFVEKVKQIFIATPLDVLASQFTFFEKMKLRRKERIMNNS